MNKRLRTDDRGVAFRNLGLFVVTTSQQELECLVEDDTRSNPLLLCHSGVLCECFEDRPPRLALVYLSAGGCSQGPALIFSLESVISQLGLRQVISGYNHSVRSSLFRDATQCRLLVSYRLLKFSICDRYVVPKRRSLTTNRRCVISQKSEEFCVFVSYSLPYDDDDDDQNAAAE